MSVFFFFVSWSRERDSE